MYFFISPQKQISAKPGLLSRLTFHHGPVKCLIWNSDMISDIYLSYAVFTPTLPRGNMCWWLCKSREGECMKNSERSIFVKHLHVLFGSTSLCSCQYQKGGHTRHSYTIFSDKILTDWNKILSQSFCGLGVKQCHYFISHIFVQIECNNLKFSL